VIGVNPSKHYSEAAHIKPVGQPHNGPDSKSNMIVLCPEHHLQFDKGVLRIAKQSGLLRIFSKIPGDLLTGSPVQLRNPHVLDEDCVSWHYEYWK
jgi:predicted restriction endonuclease